MHSIALYEGEPPCTPVTGSCRAPLLDVYEPFGTAFNDCAVILLPGGGYEGLAAHEGEGYAGIFQLWGFRAFVCSYRLGSEGHRHPAMWHDATRAVRLVRARATEWGVNPDKIVLVGSSAGGHLAASVLTCWDRGNPGDPDPVERVSSRPNLGVLCYPVITMGEGTHAGSRDQLLGPQAPEELIRKLSAERNVTAQTPPCFVWHTVEDPVVPVANSLGFASALHAAGVPFELHIYQDGGHGLGMKDGHPWVEDCLRWLKRRLAES